MGPYEYILDRIEGEYCYLVRTDIETADEMMIAIALLPEGVDIGTRLRWENLEYKVIE